MKVQASLEKTTVLLVYPRTRPRGGVPLALLAIAGPLEKAGYRVRIIDANMEDNYMEKTLAGLDQALFVGISCMTGFQIRDALRISREVKERRPSVPVVWGGWHPSILPGQTVESRFVDIVVRGQGQRTVVELADRLRSSRGLTGVLGVTYKEQGMIFENPDRPLEDLNTFPPLAYHLVNVERYVSNIPEINSRTVNYLSSQGCPHRCSFCAEVAVNKRRWSALTPQRVLEDLKSLVTTYGINGIMIEDSNFFVDKDRVRRICEGIVHSGLKIRWGFANARQDQLVRFEEELWQLMSRSGCTMLLVGVESGCQQVVDILSKNSSVEYAIELARICQRHGIAVLYSFMTGLPNEPPQAFYETLDLVDRLSSTGCRNQFMLYFYTPYPGTPLFNLAVESGLKQPSSLEDWSRFGLENPNVPWLSRKRAFEVEFVRYYFLLLYNPLVRRFKSSRAFGLVYRMVLKVFRLRWKRRCFVMPVDLFLLRSIARLLRA